MNDKEYVNNTCNKCLNKYNENDLCNIVEKINGTYGCPNENCIKNVMQAVTLWGERISVIANAISFFVVVNIERFLFYFFGIKCFRFVFRMGS